MDKLPVIDKESDHSAQKIEKSPLSSALFLVLSESGSHGVSVCEALRKLLSKGYAKLLNSNSRPRAVQVKSALKTCSDFKELDSGRFALRKLKQPEGKKQYIMVDLYGRSRGGAENFKQGLGIFTEGVSPKLQTSSENCEQLARSSDLGSPGELRGRVKDGNFDQCRKSDGKHWRCSQQTKPGFLYCEHHRQGRAKARLKGCFPGEITRPNNQDQRLETVHEEEESQIVAGNPSQQVMEQAQKGLELKLDRCHRNDGKQWQCSKQVKAGSNYCEHHQRRQRKKAKGDDSGQILSTIDAHQPLHLPEAGARAIGVAVDCPKGKVETNVYEQSTVARKPKEHMHCLQACAVDKSQIGVTGKETGNEHALISVAREFTRKKLHVSDTDGADRSQTADRRSNKRPKGNLHEQLTVAPEAKPEVLVSEACIVAGPMSALPKWKRKPNQHGHTDILQVTVGVSQSVADSLKTKTNASQRDENTEEKQVVKVVEAFHLGRTSTASNGCCCGAERANLRGKEEGSNLEGKKESADVQQQVERCHRRDGKGWQCSRQCKPGYIYCEHHQGRRSKERAIANGHSKFMQRDLDKWGLATRLKGFSQLKDKECSVNSSDPLKLGQQLQTVQSCMAGENANAVCSKQQDADQQKLKRCHRMDGKGWQCSRQAKHGFNSCEHHLSRRTTLKGSKKEVHDYDFTFDSVKTLSNMLSIGYSSGNGIAKSTPLCMQPVVLS